ncbi:MAG: SufD family Fe-S cluster assembly protein [Dehalococcoidia bacterium]|nr:SufD family Fe-S cluster assembly protein [Dehalococcoidia bacterium]
MTQAIEAAGAEARERGEPDWLATRREDAARAYASLPAPTPVLRPWRYTDLAGLDVASFTPAPIPLTVSGTLAAGGYVGSLAAAGDREVVRAHLGSLLPPTEGKFLAANAAQWRDGVLVHLPRGAAAAEPIVVTLDASALTQAAIYPRLLIVAEERSEATIVLRLSSGDARLVVFGAIEVIGGPASRVRLLIDDAWGVATSDFSWVRARLERDADLQVAALAIGGALFKQTVEVELAGEGAHSAIRAVVLGDGTQHFDFVTLQDHVAPRTTSVVEVKAALAGAARSVYYGITRVAAEAIGADADQANYNLLLSGSAKADSDPVLEILTANIVRCGHHATVGPVDQEALFYLESRGLDQRTALQLLVAGFFHSVVGELPLPGLAEQLDDRVAAKLATAAL